MILCKLSEAAPYRALAPRIAAAIDWLQNNAAAYPAPGTSLEIAPGITVKGEAPALVSREKASMEAHRRYIDIHVPLKTTETIGWAPTADMTYPRGEYDADRDVAFFGDSAHSMLHVRPGQIAVFFPEDAHAPNIGLGSHRKLCVKILVE